MCPDKETIYSLVINLSPAAETRVRATAGHQAHAAFLHAVRDVDPELAAGLHQPGMPVRPFTVSPLQNVDRAHDGMVRLRPDETYYVRITILDAGLYERFMGRFVYESTRPILRLGEAKMQIKEILSLPISHPWAGYSTWSKLAAEAYPAAQLTLEFSSPTAFSFGQKEWGKKIAVLPQPEPVFGSLMRAWNTLSPAAAHIPLEGMRTYLEEHVVIKRHDRLRTQMLHFSRSPQIGFVGEVCYGFMGDNDIARLQLNLLADFAFYAGVGMKTTMGMGQCRRTV